MSDWDKHLATYGAPAGTRTVIFGHDGSPWTTLHPFTAAELKPLGDGTMDPNPLRATGPTVSGIKYMITQAVPGEYIVGKKGGYGFVVYKSKRAYSGIFFTDATLNPNQANVLADKFCEHLKSLDF